MTTTRFRAPRISRRAFLAGGAAAGLAAAFLPLGLAEASQSYQQTALLMGTFVRFDIARRDQAAAAAAGAPPGERGAALEALLTRVDSASPLSVLNSQGSLADAPRELSLLLERSAEIHALTGGSFDPSVLPVLSLLQRGAESGVEPSRAELEEARSLVDFSKVSREGGLRLGAGQSLSLDGVAKGFIAQEMSRELSRMGCPDHIVNAGGDLVASGAPSGRGAWTVGVQSPFGRNELVGRVSVRDRALATSGVYEQSLPWASRSHLVIPRSLETPEAVSASVLARDGATADALATAFSTMPPSAVMDFCARTAEVEALLVLRSGASLHSAGWPA